MAIEQVGSIITLNPGGVHGNTGQVPHILTPDLLDVPAGTELVLAGCSTHLSVTNGLAAATFTKNGTDQPMTAMGSGGDANSAIWMGKIFYQVLPDIGPCTFKWDWAGAGETTTGSHMFSFSFWKGIDMSNPVRHGAGAQAGSGVYPITTPTLTAQTGDKIVAWLSGYCDGVEASADTWTNATSLSNETHFGDADGAWATANPTGNQTVAVAAATNFDFGTSLTAIVLIPGPGGVQYVPPSTPMVASAGTAQGIPIRTVDHEVTGEELISAVGNESVTGFAIEGKVGTFGWAVR